MYVKHLSLANVRNYARLELDLPARIHIFQGENAQGKTNLLEAIYYLSTTKSPLASSDRELIRWEAQEEVLPYARLIACFVKQGEERSLEATLVQERSLENDHATTLRKRIRLDGVPRRAIDTIGQLNVVLFLPEDIALVSGAPSERRRYLDISLCQIDTDYCQALSLYNRVITQRNALLRAIREGLAGGSELEYWDGELSHHGAKVLLGRLQAVASLQLHAGEVHAALTSGGESLSLQYLSSVSERLREQGPSLPGVQSDLPSAADLQAAILQALRLAHREERARAVTLVGPHRDDLRFLINTHDATVYGSRGQQRTVALALKMGEVVFMKERTGEMPVLLLDDVISELDRRRAHLLMQSLRLAQQVLVTTTDITPFDPDLVESAQLWCVANGSVQPLT